MPGLCDSNELIARDEGMHTDFAVMMKINAQQQLMIVQFNLLQEAYLLKKNLYVKVYHVLYWYE